MASRDPSSSSDDDSSSSGSASCGLASQPPREGHGTWTEEEHERFLVATSLFPNGPWRVVAEYVGTRSMRQTMTHAQKLLQRQARHERGLKPPGRVPAANAKRRRRKSRSKRSTSTPPESGIPIDEELELLFSPPPLPPPSHASQALVEGVSSSLAAGFESSFGALHVDARDAVGDAIEDRQEQSEECVDGVGSVGAWLDEFLRSVDVADLLHDHTSNDEDKDIA